MSPRIGQMDVEVHLQSATLSRSTRSGEPEPTWSTDATVWAQKRGRTGREFFGDEDTRSERRATFIVRATSGVSEAERVVEAASTSQVWDISSVNPSTDPKRWLVLDVKAFDAAETV